MSEHMLRDSGALTQEEIERIGKCQVRTIFDHGYDQGLQDAISALQSSTWSKEELISYLQSSLRT